MRVYSLLRALRNGLRSVGILVQVLVHEIVLKSNLPFTAFFSVEKMWP